MAKPTVGQGLFFLFLRDRWRVGGGRCWCVVPGVVIVCSGGYEALFDIDRCDIFSGAGWQALMLYRSTSSLLAYYEVWLYITMRCLGTIAGACVKDLGCFLLAHEFRL